MARAPHPKRQAEKAIKPLLALRTPRHSHRQDGKIHSIGTARLYQQIFRQAAEWLTETGIGRLRDITPAQASQYLTLRSIDIGQKQLNNERKALELHLQATHRDTNIVLDRVISEVTTTLSTRAYTPEHIQLIQSQQTPQMSLSTRLAAAAGLRAEELLTIRRSEEQRASTHRIWSDNRFTGLPSGKRYTVNGKGGLIREVMIPNSLVKELEATRLPFPEKVTSRGVIYHRLYRLIGGKSFSNRFSLDAQTHLGWSQGAHGMRHTYAQQRMSDLQLNGIRYTEALGIVSQELGHFRPEITEVYLR
ncbi:MAG: site-specific integrase [Aestuariibacter sp.]|nr:site-specific integrase [Aestuariibacter sp.]